MCVCVCLCFPVTCATKMSHLLLARCQDDPIFRQGGQMIWGRVCVCLCFPVTCATKMSHLLLRCSHLSAGWSDVLGIHSCPCVYFRRYFPVDLCYQDVMSFVSTLLLINSLGPEK